MFKRALPVFVLSSAAAVAQTQPPDRPAMPMPTRTATPAANAPAGPQPTLAQLIRANGGSLRRAALQMQDDPRQLKSRDFNLFAVPEAKPKVVLKHDLVTIIVSERSENSSDGSTDTKKDASIQAQLAQFPGLDLSNFALKNTIGSVIPEVRASGSRDFKGEGTVDRKDTLITRIQAEVVDVKPNGRLVLQARTRIVTDEEEQLLVLSGECRVQDITPDNTVLSSELFDKDVRKTHRGAVRDATRRGWVPRLLDWANPF